MFSLLLVFLSPSYFKGTFPFVRTKDTPTATAFPRQELEVAVGVVFERSPFEFRSPHSQMLESWSIRRKSKSHAKISNLVNFFGQVCPKNTHTGKYAYIHFTKDQVVPDFSISKEKWISVASSRPFPFQSNHIKEQHSANLYYVYMVRIKQGPLS